MKPIVKKAAAALAVKEVIERVQEARKPKKSVFARLRPAFVLGLLGGVGYYLYNQGKLDDVIAKGKEVVSKDDVSGNGHSDQVPASLAGTTTSGEASTGTTT